MCRTTYRNQAQWIMVFALLPLFLAVAANAQATFGTAFHYQGRLMQEGKPVNGTVELSFKLFPGQVGGAQAAEPVTLPNVVVSNGLFSVQLDFGLEAFQGAARWLEITVNGTVLGPRQPLNAAPYALFALSGNEGPQGPIGDTGPAGPQGIQGLKGDKGDKGDSGAQGIKGDTGSVGPQGIQGLKGDKGDKGDTGATGPQGTQGPKGDTGTTGPMGPKGDKGDKGDQGDPGGPPGPDGLSAYDVALIEGYTGSESQWLASLIGPQGSKGDTGSPGPQGPQGPKGDTGNTGATGPQGQQGPQGTQGLKGDTGSTGATGPQGSQGPKGDIGPQGLQGPKGDTGNTGATGQQGPQGPQGPKGDTGNTGATGSQGPQGPQGPKGDKGDPGPPMALPYSGTYSNGASSHAIDIDARSGKAAFYGSSNSSFASVAGSNLGSGSGVHAHSNGGFGLEAVTPSGGKSAVYARTWSSSWPAVWAVTQSSSSSASALTAEATGSAYAGFFSGRVHVNGTLSKSSGAFKIDHPLDPENKYLYHSFVESPDMMNIYNGNVVLDGTGAAWVTLPEWFDALNGEFRYQLTCIGGFAPIYVAEEIRDNMFLIAGGEAGMKVSWQVTGIRIDPYAQENRIPVEEYKADEERGTYLHPDVYGQPQEKSLHYKRQELLEEHSGRSQAQR